MKETGPREEEGQVGMLTRFGGRKSEREKKKRQGQEEEVVVDKEEEEKEMVGPFDVPGFV